MPLDPKSQPQHTGFTIIHSYSRAQALDDCALVDASTLAHEAGIRFPVALTSAAWADAVVMTAAAVAAGCDETGRLWEVVWMLRLAMGRAPLGADRVRFPVLVVMGEAEPRRLELEARIGPGDRAEPVITVMLPGED